MNTINLSELPELDDTKHKFKMLMKAARKETEDENKITWEITNRIFFHGVIQGRNNKN